jgi:hypothetical protein
LQSSRVHQHKVSASSFVDLIKAVINTIHIIGDSRHVQAAIRQESTHTEVVGSNPHGIDRIVRFPIGVERIGMSGRIDEFGVCDKSIDFVDNIWEWTEDAGEKAEDDLVVTDGSTDCIVVQHST